MAFPAIVAARWTALADSVANSSSMPYSPMLSSKRLAALSNLSAGVSGNSNADPQARKSENDILYIQQQKLIKKFGVDLWETKKKPAAFGFLRWAKDIKERIKARKKKRQNIYGKKTVCVLRKVATASVTSDHTNISSHGSLADYSALSSTPSLMNENASGLVIGRTHKKMSASIRNTQSRCSPLSPISGFDVNHRRPKTSGSLVLQNKVQVQNLFST